MHNTQDNNNNIFSAPMIPDGWNMYNIIVGNIIMLQSFKTVYLSQIIILIIIIVGFFITIWVEIEL